MSARGEGSEEACFTVLFLGTGAADWPREYEATAESAARGEVRGFSAMLLGGRVLVDCGPTTFDAMLTHGVDPATVSDLLITHTHGDHLDAAALERLPVAHRGPEPLRVWAERGAVARIPDLGGVDLRAIDVGDVWRVGGFEVTALAANHVVGDPERPLHYLLKAQGRSLLYATDGAWLLKETWLRLREEKLDAIVWDATNGETQGDWRIFEHNSIDMIRTMMETLRREVVVTPGARVLLTHMARTLCAPHEEMVRSLEPEGLVPAYDGMRLELGD